MPCGRAGSSGPYAGFTVRRLGPLPVERKPGQPPGRAGARVMKRAETGSAGPSTGRRPVRIAVVIPAGPGDDIADTLASVLRYTDPSRIVVIVDDTSSASAVPPELPRRQGHEGRAARGQAPRAGSGSRRPPPTAGSSRITSRASCCAWTPTPSILGPGLEAAAEQAFRRNPGAGLLGAYRVGPDGGRRDFRPAARQLRAEIGPRGLRRPTPGRAPALRPARP